MRERVKWIYYSGLGAEKHRQLVNDTGLELVLDKVKQVNVKAGHLWIIHWQEAWCLKQWLLNFGKIRSIGVQDNVLF